MEGHVKNFFLFSGITDADLLKRKTLSELIKPWPVRQKQVEEFLKDVANFHTGNNGYISYTMA